MYWAVVGAVLATGFAKPCPNNAVFLRSYEHDGASHCACLPNLLCVGTNCSVGGQRNSNFSIYNNAQSEGFPFQCLDCFCKLSGESNATAASNAGNYELVTSTDPWIQQFRDFEDPLFQATCQTTGMPRKPPVALDYLRWLHIPKAGSSFTSTLYHYLCRSFPGAQVFQHADSSEAEAYKVTARGDDGCHIASKLLVT